MPRHGKRYRASYEAIDRERAYEPAEAMSLIKGFKPAKFDETVEAHIRTGLNVRHAEEQLRGTISLPHGLGKEMTVAVFAKGDKAREAEEAGADHVGAEDLAQRVEEEGFTDFDVAIATPDMMPVVGKLGRILGPQGKMPNPKVGTVTTDVAKAAVRVEGGQGRVPHGPPGDRSHDDRQAELRRANAARELRRADRRDHPRQAGRRQGALPPDDHPYHEHGTGGEGRRRPHPRNSRGGRAGRLGHQEFLPETLGGRRCKSGAGGATRIVHGPFREPA